MIEIIKLFISIRVFLCVYYLRGRITRICTAPKTETIRNQVFVLHVSHYNVNKLFVIMSSQNIKIN